ncbi:Mpo1 family 2-hydroxy fatty acid dioxygenase [Mucilaginibacter agri]|uniref:DUF962 domain-containing protein n=1 Tax=Mucilaginibacter agri TaxID=2695265 RepID=A0A966DQE9_9SPHI|nr:Mpo1-like protein [Mucilaginibacter agri]NCD67958.1 DUF962 domain-containing protein [Mucilaginibacter agri]
MNSIAQPKLVDVYFDKYAESHQNPKNELIHWICVPLIVFSLVGLVWAIPFPYLPFLGRLNGYVSWAWLLIAFAVYYYFKLSPVLAGFMLLLILIFIYAILALLNWQHSGGPALWQSCLIIFVLSWVGQFIGHKIEGKKPSFFDDIKFLLIGPIWLMHFILLKLGIKY